MAKFCNVLVHLYLEIEVQRLYQYIQHDLDDFDQFAQYVGDSLSRLGEPKSDPTP